MLSLVLPVDHVKVVLQVADIHSESPGQRIELPEIVRFIIGLGYNLTKMESFKMVLLCPHALERLMVSVIWYHPESEGVNVFWSGQPVVGW